ncbi:MAG: acetoacetate--CoA ligase [Rhodobacterales bacterium]|nr:acetoacetate--CoA ligase [Rhodobacterales bacterium]
MTLPLWQPDPVRVRDSNLTAFRKAAGRRWAVELPDYAALHRFSIDEPEKFWQSVREETGLIAQTWGERVVVDGDRMPGAAFFPDARLNYAENLLRRRGDGTAIVFWGEDKVERRLSWNELHDAVSLFAQALRATGIVPGDRVAAIMPNMPETVIAALAVASVGGVWSSCSPDFGVQGVIDRFGQIEPKVLLAVEGYYYNGKAHDCIDKLGGILAELPTVERVVVVPYTRSSPPIGDLRDTVMWDSFIRGLRPGDIVYEHLPFNHPLFIMFSSGTTGKPKCIVHGAGGTLIQHVKEHQLHLDVRPRDRVFYFTTCGWMMWNWLITALASQATLLLYDGSPFYPDGNVLFDFADAERMTHFGTSAKYIDALNKAGLRPKESHNLASVRVMTSTGSPLAPESFDFVYAHIKNNLHLASIAGGTDIIACFVGGVPTEPVWRGEIQARMLGMAVEVFNDDGQPVKGEKGELVCTRPFPSMPVGFWNDPDGSRYHAAYFDRFDNVWCHGDFVELTEHEGIVIHGRSDAVLNPGGVRIGTSEIYRQVEQQDEVVEGIVIGQEWDNDVRVVLFVVLREGLTLDDDLTQKIKRKIRENCTPRHVPAKVVQVADIPRTKSGKITELAVRDVVHGRPVKNVEALANADSLAFFKDLPELQR